MSSLVGRVLPAVRGLSIRRLAASGFVRAALGPAIAFLVALWAIVPTLAPSVGDWDTAEFQTVGPVLGTAHPTGYPAYVILGWIASIVFQPFGNPAFTMNLLQAFLAALAVAAVTALVAVLTGRRFLALAVGLTMLVMPTVEDATVPLPVAGGLNTTPVFMRLATHADPHMFHVALVAIIFGLLAMWDRRIHELERQDRGRADRWLVAAAFVFAVAVANHSLALLLPPGIGLFVLLADWRIIRRPRSLLACTAVLVGTLAVLFAELPIRAAMNAPLVYGHPDTLGGFAYVVLAEQFRGSLIDPLGGLGVKTADIVELLAAWLGPLIYLAIVGIATSLIRRPRFLVLSGLTFLITCYFSVSYANADIERYFLVPILIAFTWMGLGLADLLAGAAELSALVADRSVAEPDEEADDAELSEDGEENGLEPDGHRTGRFGFALAIGQAVLALALLAPIPATIATRQQDAETSSGGVSEALQTDDFAWMQTMLLPADQGGLPKNSVLVSWWSRSTTLWYGQRVLHLRPDIYIVDDRTRLDDNLGSVQDVFNKFLDKQPVFVIRMDWGDDGMIALEQQFDIRSHLLGDGSVQVFRVIGRKGNQ